METVELENAEYIMEKMLGKTERKYLEWLEEDKGYTLIDINAEKTEGTVIVNENVYSVKENENGKIEEIKFIRKATDEEAKKPRIKGIQAVVEGSSVTISVNVKEAEGVTYKYIITKEGSETAEQETETITENTKNFNNLTTNETYIITVEATNSYGTTRRKVKISTIPLSELTQGKASFEITPDTKWQEKVTVRINSEYSDTNTVLQYKIGDNNWTNYNSTTGFEVTENCTIVGRYYNETTEEIGYIWTDEVTVIDDVAPVVTITSATPTSRQITVNANAVDNYQMPSTIEYKYYIRTSSGSYGTPVTGNNTCTLTQLSNGTAITSNTTYYIKVTVADKKGNIGTSAEQEVTTIPLSELTQGKAGFNQSPTTQWQEKVTMTITSTYNSQNAVLQYRIGPASGTNTYTNYTGAFEVTENTTVYGRFYDAVAQEEGYVFTHDVTVIDDVAPTITITSATPGLRQITVNASSADNYQMPSTIEYKYYIRTSSGSYGTPVTGNNSCTLTQLSNGTALSPGTDYYIKVEAADKKGNVGTSAEQKVTTREPVYVATITLNTTNTLVQVGGTYQLSVTSAVSANANNNPPPDDTSVTWTKVSGSGVTVNSNGLVTGTGDGTAVIRATAKDGGGAYAECTVKATTSNVIHNRAELEAIATNLTGSYILANDIDLDPNLDGNNDGVADGNWSPLGSYNSQFTGTFDGNGHVIRNMVVYEWVSRGGNLFAGMFAALGKNSTFCNTKFINCSSTCGSDSGDNNNWPFRNAGIVAGHCASNATIYKVAIIDSSVYARYGYGAHAYAIAGPRREASSSASYSDCYFKNVTVTAVNISGSDYGTEASLMRGGAIQNCYWDSCSLTGGKTYLSGTCTNCYYNCGSTSASLSYATGVLNSDFGKQSSFSGFDFTNTWVMVNASGGTIGTKVRPELKIFMH